MISHENQNVFHIHRIETFKYKDKNNLIVTTNE
jgi:hypothetical protein